jgi:hypothetical protein
VAKASPKALTSAWCCADQAHDTHHSGGTGGRHRLKAYQQTVQNFCQRLREFCQGRGMSFFSVGSETPLEQLLLKQLRQAEVWG